MDYREMYSAKLSSAEKLAERLESGWTLGMDSSTSQTPAIMSAFAKRVKAEGLRGIKVQTLLDVYPFEFYADSSLAGMMTGYSWFSSGGADVYKRQEQSIEMKSRLLMTTDKEYFCTADMMVECIAEDMEVKQSFWQEASRLAPEDALLATNTSGLKVCEIAVAVYRPERFMGRHWLNPPHLLPLCELVVGEKTSRETVEAMRELISAMGKRPVVVKDINGFIVNRLQFALLREALYLSLIHI